MSINRIEKYDVIIVGGGFTGLAAALSLSKAGKRVCLLEADKELGGLAGNFEFSDGIVLERFYHHWFNSDEYIKGIIDEIGKNQSVKSVPSRTGMYFNGRIWKLSTPLDLLRFKPLRFWDRIRLGLLVFRVRSVKDWRALEGKNIQEWLEPLCGKAVYNLVWRPLIESKFSVHADKVNAVWMWKKLVLRGSTRDSKGGEELAYYQGGFGALAEAIGAKVEALGSDILVNQQVTKVHAKGDRITGLETRSGLYEAEQFLFTPAFAQIADMFQDTHHKDWLASLRRVNYLANICLVLRLNKSLSDTYWLNVNDPGFPFVGVIEHTNLDVPDSYKGSHIVYLSRYIDTSDPAWGYEDQAYKEYCIGYLKEMFPEFSEDWIIEYKIWRASYAQQITERNYSDYLPGMKTPFANGWISTMAQIYPEDRGTNYAVREGRLVAGQILKAF